MLRAYLWASAVLLGVAVAASGLLLAAAGGYGAAAVAAVGLAVVGGLYAQAVVGSLVAWRWRGSRLARNLLAGYAAIGATVALLSVVPGLVRRFDEDPRSNWRFVVTRDLAGLLEHSGWPADPEWDQKFRTAVDWGAEADLFTIRQLGDSNLPLLRLLLDRGRLDVHRVYRARCNGLPCATTALYQMAEYRQLESMRLLLSRGADPSQAFEDLGQTLDPLLGLVLTHNGPDGEADTLPALDLLRSAGADPARARAQLEAWLADPVTSYGAERAEAEAAYHRRLLARLRRR